MSNCLMYDHNYELAQQTLVHIVTFNLLRFVALDTYPASTRDEMYLHGNASLPCFFFSLGCRKCIELQDRPTTAENAGKHHVQNIFCLLALPSILKTQKS